MKRLSFENQLVGKTIAYFEVTEYGDALVIGTTEQELAVIDFINKDGQFVLDDEKFWDILKENGHLNNYYRIKSLISCGVLEKHIGEQVIKEEITRIKKSKEKYEDGQKEQRLKKYLELKEEFEGTDNK